MEREEDRELWDLLGNSAPPELSPFFARNVSRLVRERTHWSDRMRGWLRPRILAPVAAAAVALVTAAVVTHQGSRIDTSLSQSLAAADLDGSDAEVAADMDDLTGGDDDSSSEIATL